MNKINYSGYIVIKDYGESFEVNQMNKISYSGYIVIKDYGESDDVLFLSTLEEPLADILQNSIANKIVTARYWTCEKKCTKDLSQEIFLKQVMGYADCEFIVHYSEITGYLWTDEKLNIGGHDLLDELRSYEGKWLILELEIYDKKTGY